MVLATQAGVTVNRNHMVLDELRRALRDVHLEGLVRIEKN